MILDTFSHRPERIAVTVIASLLLRSWRRRRLLLAVIGPERLRRRRHEIITRRWSGAAPRGGRIGIAGVVEDDAAVGVGRGAGHKVRTLTGCPTYTMKISPDSRHSGSIKQTQRKIALTGRQNRLLEFNWILLLIDVKPIQPVKIIFVVNIFVTKNTPQNGCRSIRALVERELRRVEQRRRQLRSRRPSCRDGVV